MHKTCGEDGDHRSGVSSFPLICNAVQSSAKFLQMVLGSQLGDLASDVLLPDPHQSVNVIIKGSWDLNISWHKFSHDTPASKHL